MDRIKCVLVGDPFVGKTSILTLNDFVYTSPETYVPVTLDNYTFHIRIDKYPNEFVLDLYESACFEENDKSRPLSYYPQTDIFLNIFSVVSPATFENARDKWKMELSHYCPNTPIILVGNKIDLRNDSGTIEKLSVKSLAPISYEQGLQMAKEIGAVSYMECSALLLPQTIRTIFEEAVRMVLHKSKKEENSEKCVLF